MPTGWRVAAFNRFIVLAEFVIWGVIATWVIALVTGPILQNSWWFPIDYVTGWFCVFAALLINSRVSAIAKRRGLYPYRVIENARAANATRDPRSRRARISKRFWGEEGGRQ